MTFTLTLEIHDNVSHRDMALALRRVAALIEKTVGEFEEGDKQPIRDGKEIIGEWSVSAS
jgi:hypothetical protein